MASPNDNRIIIAIGAGLVIIAAVVLALVFSGGGDQTPEAPPASRGGLTVDLAEAPTLEPTRELRCFVDGQFAGVATLAGVALLGVVAGLLLDRLLDFDDALDAGGEWDEGGGVFTRWQ